jgi:phage gp36-like protein
LIGVACDIARYRYYQDQPTELVITRYEQAVGWLKDVAHGLVDLLLEDEPHTPVSYSQPTRVFTRLVW